MAKADVLQLVSDLSLAVADQTQAESYYYDIITELGQQELLTNIVAVQRGGAGSGGAGAGGFGSLLELYYPPAKAIDLIGAFYGDRFLNHATIKEVEAYAGRDWLAVKGDPLVMVTADQEENVFRVFPRIDHFGHSQDTPNNAPLGIDYPPDSVIVVYTESRDDLPTWLELPVAFDILSREFSRESDHRDVNMASACAVVSQLFYVMVLG